MNKEKAMYVPDIIVNNPSSKQLLTFKYENFILIDDFKKIENERDKLVDLSKIKEIENQIKEFFPEKYHNQLKITNQNKQLIKDVFNVDIEELDLLVATMKDDGVSILLLYVLADIIKKTYFDNPEIFFVDFSHPIDRLHRKRECDLNFEIGIYRNLNVPLKNLIALQNYQFIEDIRLRRKEITYSDLNDILQMLELQIKLINFVSTRLEIKKNNYDGSFLRTKRELVFRHSTNANHLISLMKDRIEILSDSSKTFITMRDNLLGYKEYIEDLMDKKFHYTKIPKLLGKYIYDKLL